MEKVFITMHDLSPDARIVYASDSVLEVLGYAPHEVVGRSCFDYFHPDEVPAARKVHSRGIKLDKAAMLIYCGLKKKDGAFVYCECVFSIVYDVFVAAISIHSKSSKSEGRALTAPVIRRVFSTSPNDPRYHMLTHLSSKFESRPRHSHEPRCVLILNRFTRSLTIMYASHALKDILDFPPDEAVGKSFYECISQHCLQDSVEALERAKENDSIAYLRFQWRDPRTASQSHERIPERRPARSKRKRSPTRDSDDNRMAKKPAVRRSDNHNNHRPPKLPYDSSSESRPLVDGDNTTRDYTEDHNEEANRWRDADGVDGDNMYDVDDPIEDEDIHDYVSDTSDSEEAIRDVEAIISCTSDGLVVVLRRARPMIPKPLHGTRKGIYASPWANEPLGLAPTLSPSDSDVTKASLMETIQQVAVFAWSLKQMGAEAILPEDQTERGVPESLTNTKISPFYKPKIANGESSTGSSSSGFSGNEANLTPATSASRNPSESTGNNKSNSDKGKDVSRAALTDGADDEHLVDGDNDRPVADTKPIDTLVDGVTPSPQREEPLVDGVTPNSEPREQMVDGVTPSPNSKGHMVDGVTPSPELEEPFMDGSTPSPEPKDHLVDGVHSDKPMVDGVTPSPKLEPTERIKRLKAKVQGAKGKETAIIADGALSTPERNKLERNVASGDISVEKPYSYSTRSR